jgi:REP element-mobilizing transposase RayT
MPRTNRLWIPGTGAHIISRFVDRRFVLVDDADRGALFDSITLARDRWDWEWLSYAMMSSHVHYAMIAGLVDPERFFRSVHTRFAKRYHARAARDTLGPVFADRPALHPVKEPLLPRLVAYQHRNPVEAGVVERPSQSTWTSHRAYLRLDPAPPWLDVERALDILGFRDTAAGRRRFDEFVMEVDLKEYAWSTGPTPEVTSSGGASEGAVDWIALVAHAREVTGLPRGEALTSRSHCAARTRRLVGIIATRDLGQTYASVADRLEMSTGSVYNLVVRRPRRGDLKEMLSEMRRRLAADELAEDERSGARRRN